MGRSRLGALIRTSARFFAAARRLAGPESRLQVGDLLPHILGTGHGLEDFRFEERAIILEKTMVRDAESPRAQAKGGGEVCGFLATEAAASLEDRAERLENCAFPAAGIARGEEREDAGEEFASPLAVEDNLGRLVIRKPLFLVAFFRAGGIGVRGIEAYFKGATRGSRRQLRR